MLNPHTATDCYKVGHIKQYHPKMTFGYSNYTNRNNKFAPYTDKVVVFGVQAMITQMVDSWDRNFFDKPSYIIEGNYEQRMSNIFGKGVIDSAPIMKLHNLGYLPIKIKALPEGSIVPVGV